jgi:hypothetical protein
MIVALQSRRGRRRFWSPRRILLVAILLGAGWLGFMARDFLRTHIRRIENLPPPAARFVPLEDEAARNLVATIGQLYPRHLLAWQFAADRLELSERPEVVQLRRGLFDQDRTSLSAQLALATSALRTRNLATAEIALAAVDPRDRLRPEALVPAAVDALVARRLTEADTFLAAIESEDTRAGRPFYRSCVMLLQNNAELADQARTTLAQIATQTKGPLRLQAWRALIKDAGARGQSLVAIDHARALTSDPDATLRDHLVRLTLEGMMQPAPADATKYAATVSRLAAAGPEQASLYVTWLGVQGRQAEARDWIKTLPHEVAATPAVRSALADTLLGLHDWDGLSALLAEGAWGSAADSTVRLAFSAHLLRQQAPVNLRQQLWANALVRAGNNQATLEVLFRLAQAWNWPDESRDTLSALVRVHPDQVWAFHALALACADGPTARLAAVYADWSASHPEDLEVAGRSILLTLLTQTAAPTPGFLQAVRLFYQQAPLDPRRAVPYAFARYQAGAASEALTALEKCSPSQLREPSRALYYGLVLAAEGHPAAAARSFEFAKPDELLPEEKALLSAGLERVR